MNRPAGLASKCLAVLFGLLYSSRISWGLAVLRQRRFTRFLAVLSNAVPRSLSSALSVTPVFTVSFLAGGGW